MCDLINTHWYNVHLQVPKKPGSGNLLKTIKLLLQTFVDRRSLLLLPLLFGMGLMTSLIIADYSAVSMSLIGVYMSLEYTTYSVVMSEYVT